MEALRAIGSKMKQLAMDLTDAEMAVHRATNTDPWGPTGTEMTEIAELTKRDYDTYREVMGMLYRRMTEPVAEGTDNWRFVYKSLLIIDFLIKHGSPRVIDELRRDNRVLVSLKSFKFVDMKGADKGLNVRQRAEALLELLDDVEAIKEERAKAKKNKDKYKGVSSDEMGGVRSTYSSSYGGGGGGDSDWDGGPAAKPTLPSMPAADPQPQASAAKVSTVSDDFGDGDFGAFSEPASQPGANAGSFKKKLSDTKVTVQLNAGAIAPPSSSSSSVASLVPLQPPSDKPQQSPAPAADPFGDFSAAPAAAAPAAAPVGGGDAIDLFGADASAPAPPQEPVDLFGSSDSFASAVGSSTSLDSNSLDKLYQTQAPSGMPQMGTGMPQMSAGMPQMSQMGMPQMGAGMPQMGAGMPQMASGMPQMGMQAQMAPQMMSNTMGSMSGSFNGMGHPGMMMTGNSAVMPNAMGAMPAPMPAMPASKSMPKAPPPQTKKEDPFAGLGF